MPMVHRCLLCALALIALAPTLAQVKGAPRVVTITGPGVRSPLVVRGDGARWLGLGGFEDLQGGYLHAPRHLGPALDLNRDGWDHARYYAACAGQRGYVQYIGLYNGSSEYDGRWFHVSTRGEQSLRHILSQKHITLGGCTR
jgi:hypothetical protein